MIVTTNGAGREDPDADFLRSKKGLFQNKSTKGKNKSRGRAGYQNTSALAKTKQDYG